MNIRLIKLILALSFFFLVQSNIWSQEEESIGDIISRYFNTEENVNIPLLELSYGPEWLSFYSDFSSSFEDNYTTEIQYGFFRYDKRLSRNGILYFSSERAFFGNSSSRFKPSSVSDYTIKTEMYRYGGTYYNGFGIGEEKGSKFLFSHSSSIMQVQSDIESFTNNENDNRLLYQFETETNFGMAYSSGLIYVFGEGVTSLEIKYHHNVIWSDFQFLEWSGSWILENLLQRTPDLFHEYFISQFGAYYPIIYHIYKTGISYLIYEGRSRNSYWPFKGSEVLTQRGVRLGVKFAL
ncbi:MAG: hypothetical protein CVV25_14620 [Ignavibacteriae bacterium HGW-Ignavibacteriae-4]|jgi:hypothetical protein|nr:MAG: hypothetical protein CVV25_14620 [Ignavibacteriae bacterium HGW-Ignavibacteriae-4]